MKRRAIALLAAMALMMATAAVPALAAPKDAQGCENTKAGQLDKYCETS